MIFLSTCKADSLTLDESISPVKYQINKHAHGEHHEAEAQFSSHACCAWIHHHHSDVARASQQGNAQGNDPFDRGVLVAFHGLRVVANLRRFGVQHRKADHHHDQPPCHLKGWSPGSKEAEQVVADSGGQEQSDQHGQRAASSDLCS
ncbi:hypothetical protein MITS9509_00854 [Synechococcus sp. MIT S9509]|nr:hypothetical protein MITS9504_00996 [Synechococcus sp. MIT S9504]KZR92981.1 hypothetical protein MITS9509_00854 [Synechococcus sp. MIT S9509]